MHLTIKEPRAGEAVIALEGSLDWDTVPEIRKKLLKLVGKRISERITIDLSSVPEIDSAGIALLVEAMKSIYHRHGVLQITGINEKTRQLIHLVHLDEALGIEIANSSHAEEAPGFPRFPDPSAPTGGAGS